MNFRAIASLVVVGLLAAIPLTIAFYVPDNEVSSKILPPTDADNMMNSEMTNTDPDTSNLIRCFCNLPKCLEASGGVQTCTTKLGCFSELQPVLPRFDGVPSQSKTTTPSPITDVPIPKVLDDEAAASALVDENALRAKYGCLELMPINMTCRAILRSMEGEESEFPVLQTISNRSNNNDDYDEDIIRAYHCCESNMCNDITHVAAAAPAAQAALAAIFQQIMAPLTANITDRSSTNSKVVADATGTATNSLDNASPISSTPLLVDSSDGVFGGTFVTVSSMTTFTMNDNLNTTKNVTEPDVSTENVSFIKYVNNYTTGVQTPDMQVSFNYSVTDDNNESRTESILENNSTFDNVTTSTVAAALNDSDIADTITTATKSSVLNSSNVDVLPTVSTIMQDSVNYSTPADVVLSMQPFAVVKPTVDFVPTNAAVVNVETTPKSVSDNSAANVVPVMLKEFGNDSATNADIVVTSSYDSAKTSTTTTNVTVVPVVNATNADNIMHLENTSNATNTGNETSTANMTTNNQYITSNGSATLPTAIEFENYTRVENITANQTDSADVVGPAAATTVSTMQTVSAEPMQPAVPAEPITVVKSPEYNELDTNKKSHVINKRHDKEIVSKLTTKQDQDLTLPITQKSQLSEPTDNQIFEEYPIDKVLTEKVLNEIINEDLQALKEKEKPHVETVSQTVEETIDTTIPTWWITVGGVVLITTTMIVGTIFLGKIVRKLMRQADISNIRGQCSNPGKPCACSGGRPASDSAGHHQCRLDNRSVVIPMKPSMPVRSYNRGSHYVDSTGNTTYVYTRIPVPLSDPPMPRHF